MMPTASFTTLTAENTGLSKSHLSKLIKAGNAIRPHGVAAFRVSDVPVTVSDLIAFSKAAPDDQGRVVDLLRAGKAKTITEALDTLAPPPPPGPVAPYHRIRSELVRLPTRDRDAFVDELYDVLLPSFERARARREGGDA